MPSQAQSIHVVSVDSTPANAKGIMAGLIKASVPVLRTASQVTNSWKAVEKDYNLVHIANCEGEVHYSHPYQQLTLSSAIREVKPVLTSLVIAPQVLV
jgi:hypothetical protein